MDTTHSECVNSRMEAKRFVLKVGTSSLTDENSRLDGLTIYKYYLTGSGHVVADYVGPSAKKFRHAPLNKKWGSTSTA
jgi:hypothetical protein